MLHIDTILEADKGEYRLVAYNECGETKSAVGSLIVDIPARFVKDMSGYTDLVLCVGDRQALSVAATGTPHNNYSGNKAASASPDTSSPLPGLPDSLLPDNCSSANSVECGPGR